VINLWDIAGGRPVTSCPALTNDWPCVVLSPDGKRLYTGGTSESCIWNIDSGERIAILTNALAYLGNAAFSPDGRRLAARFGNAGNSKVKDAQRAAGLNPRDTFAMRVWNADTGAELATYDGRRPTRPTGPSPALAAALASGTMFAFTMLPDNRTALFQNSSAGVVWDLDSGRQLRRVEAGPGVISPDFRRLCGTGEALQVFDFESGRVISAPRGPSGRDHPSSFSPDGRRLWTSSTDGIAKLWDADTGRELLTLKTGIGAEARPFFSADGGSVLLIAHGRAQLLPAESWR